MKKRKYLACRGGHAPGHLREAFLEYAEDGTTEFEFFEGKRSLSWLLGQLWNCTDIVPRYECSELEIPCGSTYAQAVRKLKLQV